MSDIAVVQFVLAEVGSLSAHARDALVGVSGQEQNSQRRIHPAIAVATAVMLTAGMLSAAGWMLWPSTVSPEVARFAFPLPQGQQFSATGRNVVAISPDGRQLAYLANSGLHIRSLSEFRSRVIPGTEANEGGSSPVFSPDGTSIAFNSLQGLKRVPVSGGTPVTVCYIEQAPYGLTWDATGLIAGQGTSGVVRCPASGGRPEQLVKVDQVNEIAHGPQLLPGGDALLYTLAKATEQGDRWDKAQIVVESLTSHNRKTVLDGASDAKYLPSGHLIFVVGGDLFASRFDLATQSIVGGRVAVLEGVRRTLNATTGSAHLAASNAGTLVYVPGPPGRATSERAIAKASRSGAVTTLPARSGPYIHVRATRDGTRLALDTDDGKEANVWIYETDGKSDVNRLTFGGKNRLPIWSPDGQRVAFQSDREGDLAIWVQRIDGSGLERLTKPDMGEAHVPESWSPDGANIAFAVRKEGTRPTFELRMLSINDKKSAPFGGVRSIGEPIGAVFSPDGRWIAYHSRTLTGNDTSTPIGLTETSSRDVGVFVQPFPATGLKYQAPQLTIDFQPVWSASGEELFYIPLAASGQIAAVRLIKTGSGIRFGTPENIPARVTASRTSGATRAFDVLPDGQFVGPISSNEEAALATAGVTSEIRVVLNWFEELKKLVPASR